MATKEVCEATGGDSFPAVLSYSALVNMNQEINIPLLGENALGRVFRQKRYSYHLVTAWCSNLCGDVAVMQRGRKAPLRLLCL